MGTDWARYSAWALDFIRAVRQRPLWARLLFGIALGRHAYREFIGLMDALERDGYSPYFDYGLEHGDWHADKTPAFWWRERAPAPLKRIED